MALIIVASVLSILFAGVFYIMYDALSFNDNKYRTIHPI